jgi:hypothetical protein
VGDENASGPHFTGGDFKKLFRLLEFRIWDKVCAYRQVALEKRTYENMYEVPQPLQEVA